MKKQETGEKIPTVGKVSFWRKCGRVIFRRWEDRPLSVQLFFSLGWCIVIMLLVNWLINNLLFERYFRIQRKNDLEMMYQQVNALLVSGNDQDEMRIAMNHLAGASNQRVALLEWDRDIVYFSVSGVTISSGSGTTTQPLISTPVDLLGLSKGEYVLSEMENEGLNQSYLVLTGALDCGLYLVINSPLDSIWESVEISNQFLLIAGIFTLFLSMVIIWYISRTFTRPIKELLGITHKIAKLDFSARYKDLNGNEIGRLGESINELSMELERNISGLKTANRQLQRDNELKTKQAETRREFISNVSHEFKTPLALIVAYSEGLLEDVSADPESQRYYAEIIHDEAEKMGLLIQKMIGLMQLESGDEELSISQFNINQAVSDSLRRYNILMEEKKVAVDYFVGDEYFVWGDPFFIENVLNNYISNAYHHVSNKGEIRISIERVPAETARHIRVSVFNTGDPIPEESIQHIWESFYKVDRARSRSYGGTGIGLSVVSAIMHAHNMPFGVQNEENGVTFWFELEEANHAENV